MHDQDQGRSWGWKTDEAGSQAEVISSEKRKYDNVPIVYVVAPTVNRRSANISRLLGSQ